MNTKTKLISAILAIAILAGGVLIMKKLTGSHQRPSQPERADRGILVEVMQVTPISIPATIHATGTVRPRKMVQITPQVNGTVLKMSPGLVDGGFVSKGDLLITIDPSDYTLEVSRQKAQVDRAALDLAMAEKKAAIAANEWQHLHPDIEPDPLAVHIPQLKQARSALKKAQAELDLAELHLNRTSIISPFDGRIIAESIDTGQYIRAGSPVATLIDSESAEVIIPLSLSDLDWITVPRKENLSTGPVVDIFITAQTKKKRRGRIIRSLGQVDQKDRMTRVVALVEDPFGLQDPATNTLELVPNTFVDVIIHGRTMKNVLKVQENVLRQEHSIHVMDKDGRLRIQHITIIRREKNNVFIKANLKSTDRILLTWINGAANGMLLRAVSDKEQP